MHADSSFPLGARKVRGASPEIPRRVPAFIRVHLRFLSGSTDKLVLHPSWRRRSISRYLGRFPALCSVFESAMVEPRSGAFSDLIEGEQNRLLGFLVMLTGDRQTADDLLQETLLELWRIRRSFTPGTDFGAWARSVARIRVHRHRRDRGRRRFVPLAAEVMEQLAETWGNDPIPSEGDPREAAMAGCVESLEPDSRHILSLRYNQSWPHRRIALETGRSEDAVKMLLSRLRKRLHECVEEKLREDA